MHQDQESKNEKFTPAWKIAPLVTVPQIKKQLREGVAFPASRTALTATLQKTKRFSSTKYYRSLPPNRLPALSKPYPVEKLESEEYCDDAQLDLIQALCTAKTGLK